MPVNFTAQSAFRLFQLYFKQIDLKALLCQSIKKAPGPNVHNFRIFCILWDWNPDRIISVVVQAIRL